LQVRSKRGTANQNMNPGHSSLADITCIASFHSFYLNSDIGSLARTRHLFWIYVLRKLLTDVLKEGQLNQKELISSSMQ